MLHIGNYFGSLKPLVDLASDSNNETFLMVADYHALTSLRDPALLKQYTYDIVKDYIAAGVDPKEVVLLGSLTTLITWS